MNTFLKKVLYFLILPFTVLVLLVVGYIIYDPFKVVQSYDSYSSLQINRGYISTEMFLKNYKKENYNSFVFGSSRIFGYNIDTWKQYLDENAKVYSFDAYGEKIQGVYHKLRFLDSLGVDIKNAFIAIDVDFTFDNTLSEPRFLYIEHPLLTRESGFDFHETHFLAYLNPGFILSFYGNKFFGLDNEYVRKYYYSVEATFDPKTNRPFRSDLEKRIESEPNYYDSPSFYVVTDSLKMSPFSRIDLFEEEALIGIKRILSKHNTQYKVIINPLYSQEKFNPKDMEMIQNVFGWNNVYDFSGRNQFTTSKYNYYEESHFRPLVGDSIMSIVYKK